jgi:hypothetical protein
MDMPISSIWIISFFLKALKYGNIKKCWRYVERDEKPLCIDFYNFVPCHALWTNLLLNPV